MIIVYIIFFERARKFNYNVTMYYANQADSPVYVILKAAILYGMCHDV